MDERAKRHIELAGTVTVGPKGQVVIPADIREKMQIAPGDKLVALYIADKCSVGFVSEAKIQRHIERMGADLAEIRSVLDQ